jgi:hypothetical protein
MCLSGLSTALYKVKKKFGREKMVRFFQEALESINCVERLVAEGNIDCHFERNGFLEAAFKPAHYDGLKEQQQFLAEHLDHTTFLVPPEVAKPLVPNNRMIFDTKRFLYYFRLSPDGKRMLFGGRPKKFWKPTLDKAREIRNSMLHVYPHLEKYAIEYAGFGKVCFTVDRFPIIGERQGIYYGMGYCGHGVAMATYFGIKLSDLMLGKGLDTAFADKRFTPVPL